jgi:hypothetical protein
MISGQTDITVTFKQLMSPNPDSYKQALTMLSQRARSVEWERKLGCWK